MDLRLNIRPVPMTAAAIAIAIAIALGNWQSRRAEEKLVLRERFEAMQREPPIHVGKEPVDAEALDFRPVTVSGEWVPAWTVYLDNRVVRGVPGYHVVMPLKIEGSQRHILVNRGWVRMGRSRRELPDVPTPNGPVRIAGQARAPVETVFQLAGPIDEGRLWQHLGMQRFREWSRLDLQPAIVLQTSESADGLVREWERPGFGIDKHKGYAVQWYSLAALTLAIAVFLALRTKRA